MTTGSVFTVELLNIACTVTVLCSLPSAHAWTTQWHWRGCLIAKNENSALKPDESGAAPRFAHLTHNCGRTVSPGQQTAGSSTEKTCCVHVSCQWYLPPPLYELGTVAYTWQLHSAKNTQGKCKDIYLDCKCMPKNICDTVISVTKA